MRIGLEERIVAVAEVRKPWVGDLYGSQGLLLLGESHYWSVDRCDDLDITVEVVKLIASGAERKRHFTNIERAVTGCAVGQTDPAKFWQTVTYANFCQGAVSDAGTRPTRDMWDAGVRTFPFLLGMLKPGRMVVFGSEVWSKFSRLEGLDWQARTGNPVMHEGNECETGYLLGKGGAFRVHCMGIPHPASFGWGDPLRWHLAIKQFLDKPLQE